MSVEEQLIGGSAGMQEVRNQCALFAPRRRTIVIIGESGTGKSLVAGRLWRRSGCAHPLIRIAASELRAEFIQTELAGHTDNAFTGAVRTRRGLVEGPGPLFVFLDDGQDLEWACQPYLLDAMEGKPLRPRGAARTFIPDVRWVVGLQCSPEALVAAGRLRPDLAARWGYLRIIIPPLREHPEDIGQLAPHLLARMAAAEGLPPLSAARQTVAILLRQSWPGNVRELDNVLYAALCRALADEASLILPHHLPEGDWCARRRTAERGKVDEAAIAAALAATDGVVTHAAHRLGVSRRTLYRRLGPMRRGQSASGGPSRPASPG